MLSIRKVNGNTQTVLCGLSPFFRSHVSFSLERSGRAGILRMDESFYPAQNERGWIMAHYGDECWMTMALLRGMI
jgi:hypothetical protein